MSGIGLGLGSGLSFNYQSSGAVAGPIFDELWVGSNGASPAVAWTTKSGTPTLDGAGHLVSANAFILTRNVGTADYKLTVTVAPDNQFPRIRLRSNSAGTVYTVLQIATDGKLHYYETPDDDGTANNIVVGTTVMDLSGTRVNNVIEVTMLGSAISIKLNGTPEIAPTAAQGLTNTYMGLQWVNAPGNTSTIYFGEVKAQ